MEEVKKIESETNALILKAKEFQIVNETQYVNAMEEIKSCSLLKKAIVLHYADPKKKSHEAWKSICNAEKIHLEPVEKAEEILRLKSREYKNEQDRIAREEFLKQQAEERKKAEELQIQLASTLEKAGMTEQAEAIINQEVIVKPVEMQKVTKVEGVSYVTKYYWRKKPNFDISKVQPEFLMLDEKKINAIVTALKNETKINGIEVYSEQIERIRA